MMDQQQTQQADAEPDDVARDDGAQPRLERLKTIGLWCALLAVSMALLGSGLTLWRSLQADKAISLVARSAMQKAPAADPVPLGGAAPGRTASAGTPTVAMAPNIPRAGVAASAVAAPVSTAAPPVVAAAAAAAAPAGSAAPAGPASEHADAASLVIAPGPVTQAALSGGALSSAAPKARTRSPVVKTGSKTAQRTGRAPARSKALAQVKLKPEGRAPGRKLAAPSVQQRLNLCKEKAGEAAAACFARACRSYARHAYICVNDEPVRRRR